MRLRLLLAGTAAVALLASGCSTDSASTDSASTDSASRAAGSGAPTASAASTPASSPAAAAGGWVTGQDVLDALAAAGLPCTWSGDGEQVLQVNFLTGQASELPAVRCDGYGVQVTASSDLFFKDVADSSQCVAPTAEEIASGAGDTQFVVGDTWVVLPDGTYPADVPPEAFVKAFGGQIKTVLEIFQEACPGAVIPAPAAPAPAPSASAG